jgi:hypothetical protein
MKKYIITLVALGAVVSASAQGIINYNMRVTGSVVAHVYTPQAADINAKLTGNTAAETPVGTQVYTGSWLTGSGWSAQLFSANLAGQEESSLVAIPASVATFRTGTTLGGTIVASALVVPNVPANGTGTFQLRAWNNVGGTLTTWAQAEAAWMAGTIAAGKSDRFTISGLSDGISLNPNMVNLRSFNVYFVPEPTTFALLGLGALGMLIFRRK